MPIAMIVHGGAWAIPDAEVEAHVQGVGAALDAGWRVLIDGGSALDACEAAVRVLEDDPTFDAGVGSFLNANGEVELDAAMMDGRTLQAGAVAAVRRIRNPVQLARHVMQSEHVLLVGAGAERRAAEVGLPLCDPQTLIIPRERARWERVQPHFPAPTVPTIIPRERARWERVRANPSLASGAEFRGHDTVGALARDMRGDLAAAISTGGTLNKLPGRVGDSPLIGCGFYADNEAGACCATGHGESIMRVVLSKSVVDDLAAGASAAAAARRAIETLARRTGGAAGCIVLGPDGSIGLYHNTPRMAHAYRCGDAPPVIGIRGDTQPA